MTPHRENGWQSATSQRKKTVCRCWRSGCPLSAWKRAFVLSPDLQACRRNVIEYDYVRGNYSNQWFYPGIAEAPDEVLESNRATTAQFLAPLALEVDPDLVWTGVQKGPR